MEVKCLVDCLEIRCVTDINTAINKPEEERGFEGGRYLFSAEQIIGFMPTTSGMLCVYRYYDYQAQRFEEAVRRRADAKTGTDTSENG